MKSIRPASDRLRLSAGGGAVTIDVKPLQKWQPLTLSERGELVATFGTVVHTHLDRSIAIREIGEAAKVLS